MSKYLGIMAAILLMASLPLTASAEPKLTLELSAELEVQVEEDGKTVTKRIKAEQAEPGQEIIYTLKFRNDGSSKAANVRLKDKIPDNTTYVADSAWGEGAEILFSIDDAQSFKQPALLQYEVSSNGKTEKRKATPEKYTHIRWVVKEVAAGAQGEVGYRARVD